MMLEPGRLIFKKLILVWRSLPCLSGGVISMVSFKAVSCTDAI